MIESIDTILPAVFVFWALKLTSSLLFVSPIVRYSHIAVDKFAIFFFLQQGIFALLHLQSRNRSHRFLFSIIKYFKYFLNISTVILSAEPLIITFLNLNFSLSFMTVTVFTRLNTKAFISSMS